MQVERMQLVQGDGHRRIQMWRRGHPAGHDAQHVTLGTLPDGRWYVTTTGMATTADAYADEPAARAYAAGLTAGEDWTEAPANFDAHHQPIPAEGWVRRGGYWVRDDTGISDH